MISARSQGLPAIAVPGDDAWEPEWTQLLVGRYVSVVLDCDRAGRQAARRIAGDLKTTGVCVSTSPVRGRMAMTRVAGGARGRGCARAAPGAGGARRSAARRCAGG